jgi:anti-sigma regulatory factor (Ser/Thr protein kinase)
MPQNSQKDGRRHQLERRFPPEPGSASAARRFILDIGWSADDELNRRLSTAVSEVATNAILHARTPFVVRAVVGTDSIRVDVSDQSPNLPERDLHDPLQPTGRGLLILDRITDRWGISPEPSGKSVWFEVERGRATVDRP